MRIVLNLFLVCFLWCSWSLSAVKAQSLSFDNEPLNVVFEKIEKATKWQFNFDPELLSAYFYTGTFDETEAEAVITEILKASPLVYQKSGGVFLIYLAKPNEFIVCGYLKRFDDGTPVSWANIQLVGTTIGTESDENGFFRLTIPGSQKGELMIQYLGLQSKSIPLEAFSKKECLDILLEPEIYTMGLKLVVVGYLMKEITEGQGFGSTNLDFDKIVKKYGFLEHDILKAVQLLPGLTSVDESASNLNIRGSTPDQNLIVWEGATLYDPGHIFGLISSVNPFVVDKVKVFKSASDPKYDNRVGAIVDISLPDQISKKFKAGIGSTLTEAHSYLELPIVKNKLSVTLSGRTTTNRFFNSPTFSNYSEKIFQTNILGEEDNGSNVGFSSAHEERLSFYDWNGKILFKPAKSIFFETSYFQSRNDFNYFAKVAGDDVESRTEFLTNSDLFASKIKKHWSTGCFSEIYINRSLYSSDSQSLLTNNSESGFAYESSIDNGIIDFNVGLNHQFAWNNLWSASAGYSYKQLSVDYSLNQVSLTDKEVSGMNSGKANFHNFTGVLEFNKNKLSFKTGLRGTFYNQINKGFLSPRINVQYALVESLKWKLSAGHYLQFISQLARVGNNTINANYNLWILNGNESDEILTAQKLSSGFVYSKNNWLIDMEAYYYRTSGLSSLSTSLNSDLLIEGTGRSRMIGFDVLIKKDWNHYKLWLNYTLSQQNYKFPNKTKYEFPANNDQRHNLSIFNNYQVGKWNFSLINKFSSGLPYSTPAGITEVISKDQQNVYYKLLFDRINDERLPVYNRTDIGISYKTTLFKEKLNLEFNCSLLNVFNRNNIFSREYFIGDIEFSEEPRAITIEKYQLKRTPQVLFRIFW